MALPRAIEKLFEATTEIGEYVERIRTDISQVVREHPIAETDMLLMHSHQLLFTSKIEILGCFKSFLQRFLKANDPRQQWNTIKEQVYRYIWPFVRVLRRSLLYYHDLIDQLEAKAFVRCSLAYPVSRC